MKFSVATTLLVAASTVAGAPLAVRQEDEKCDIAKCGIAAAPTGVGCVGAIAAAGANPLADAGCAAGLLNLGVNTPAPCKPCLAEIGDKIPEPVKDVVDTVKDGAGDAVDAVKEGLGGLFSRQDKCDIAKCGVAAAPTGVGCVSAIVELGANPLADAGCAAGLLNLGVNTPDVCKPCLAEIGDKIPEPVKDVAETVKEGAGDAVDAVKEGLGGLFSRQDKCDIAACGIAAGPTGVGCVSAIVELGANPLADAGCAAGLLNLGVNTPDVCKPCVAEIGDKIPEPVKDVADTVKEGAGDAVDAVKEGLGSIF